MKWISMEQDPRGSKSTSWITVIMKYRKKR